MDITKIRKGKTMDAIEKDITKILYSLRKSDLLIALSIACFLVYDKCFCKNKSQNDNSKDC